NMISAVANGGTIFKPRIVNKIETESGVNEVKPEIKGKLAATQKTLDIIRDSLRGVVSDARGTGRAAAISGIVVAGKTGTAQVIKMKESEDKADEDLPYEFRDHAWFVAFAPYENPTIAVAVLVEHGGHGGSAAAPIAGRLIKSYLLTQ
ncbi:MAG: penicillin-binding transpeptidase domain-containing protein, partial [Nitrospinota bacterium]